MGKSKERKIKNKNKQKEKMNQRNKKQYCIRAGNNLHATIVSKYDRSKLHANPFIPKYSECSAS